MGLNMNDFVEYAEKFKGLEKEFELFLKKWMTQQASNLVVRTKEKTPVDTGNLRNSWYFENYKRSGNKAQIEINNSADYASFIEFGTPARPNWKWADGAHMLTKSLFEIEQTMPNDFDKAFTEFLKSKGLL